SHIQFEQRYRHENGDIIWGDTIGWPIHGRGGQVQYIIMVVVDITRRRQIDEQMRHSEKMQVVGQLAGGIAHEFNNLLMAIATFAHLVHEEISEEEPREDLLRILALCERGGALTDELLVYSRRHFMRLEVLDLNEVIEQMLKMLEHFLPRTITIEVDLAPSLAPIKADSSQIQQIMMNLALNARDAMPDGGILRVRTSNEPLIGDPGESVALIVEDTGFGMTEDIREHIFEPFFTTKEIGEGTGLGLSGVYGVVQQLGGTIDVDTAPGRGTRFTIHFPSEAGGQMEAAPMSKEELGPCERSAPRTILYAEGEEAVRSATSRALEAFGHRVLSAASGEEALRLSHEYEGPIDLLLTDMIMTGLSGPQLAAAVHEGITDLKVIYLSGHADEELVGLFGEDGLNEVLLRKPVTIQTLCKAIEEVFASQK
ncbi:MAG: ATP-binding protein, partial [Bradymonadaceae bacterium]